MFLDIINLDSKKHKFCCFLRTSAPYGLKTPAERSSERRFEMFNFAKLRVLFSLSLLVCILVAFSIDGFFVSKESLSCGKCSVEEKQHIYDMKTLDSLSYYLKNNS